MTLSPSSSESTTHPGLCVLLEGLKHQCLKKIIKPILTESRWQMMSQLWDVWSAIVCVSHGARPTQKNEDAPSFPSNSLRGGDSGPPYAHLDGNSCPGRQFQLPTNGIKLLKNKQTKSINFSSPVFLKTWVWGTIYSALKQWQRSEDDLLWM